MSKSAYALPVVALLFFVGFIANVVDGDASVANMMVQWTIVLLLVATFLFLRHEARVQERFLAWLDAHVEEVRAGTAVYEGVPLTYATRVHSYDVVISFLIVSLRIPVRVSVGPGVGLRLGCAAVTLVFGWWGIPWGPAWTIKALYHLARGNPTMTIGGVVEGEPHTVPPRAVANG